MPTLGAAAVVLRDGEVLLIKRRDFEVWALPGGGIEAGESAAQAAVREVREETGIEVRLTRLVGVYSRPGWIRGGDHALVFAAEEVGGALKPQPEEALAVGYFAVDALPKPFAAWHRRRIADAVAGKSGLAVEQDVRWPLPTEDFGQIRRLVDESGLSPADFYRRYFGSAADA